MIKIINRIQLLSSIKKRPHEFVEALEKGMRDGLREFEGWLISKQLSGRKSKNYGLKRQSGIAALSLHTNVRRYGIDVYGNLSVGKSAWYLKVHQHYNFNGYIKPVNAMWLTIPVSRAAQGRSARDFSDLYFIKPVGKDPLLVRNKGRKGNIEIMYALKKRVYIPKRLRFYESFGGQGKRTIERHIERYVNTIN